MHVSKARLRRAYLDEHRGIAEVVASLSDEQWRAESGCSGWTVGEVAAHCTLGDHFWRTGLSVLLVTLRLHRPRSSVARIQSRWAGKGRAAVLSRLREDRVSFVFRLGPAWVRLLSYSEQLIHSEDIRRPLGIARTREPDGEAVWALISMLTRWLRRVGAPGVLEITDTAGRRTTLELRPGKKPRTPAAGTLPDATLRGNPLELALFLAGRPSKALIEGDSPLAGALTTAKFGFG